MADALHALVLDLVEWTAKEPRSYPNVLEAWRTSCPRLTVWEDAVDQGYVSRERLHEGKVMVKVTSLGEFFPCENGRSTISALDTSN